MVTKVSDLLKEIGSQVWTVDVEATIRETLLLMAEKQIGAVPVVEGGTIRGMFSERDYVNYVAASGHRSLNEPVRKLMVHPVFFVLPEQTCEECLNLMTTKSIRHVPVLSENELVGMITIGDIVKRLLTEKDSRIKNLEHFAWTNVIG